MTYTISFKFNYGIHTYSKNAAYYYRFKTLNYSNNKKVKDITIHYLLTHGNFAYPLHFVTWLCITQFVFYKGTRSLFNHAVKEIAFSKRYSPQSTKYVM